MPSQDELDSGVKQLIVAAWMWTSDEWASIVRATNATQLPILKQALRELKGANNVSMELSIFNPTMLRLEVYKFMLFIKTSISSQCYINSDRKKFGTSLKERSLNLKQFTENIKDIDFSENGILSLIDYLELLDTKHYRPGSDPSLRYATYEPFEIDELNKIFEDVNSIIDVIGKPIENYLASEDSPIQINNNNLSAYVDKIADENASLQFVQFMTMRINSLLSNTVISSVINNKSEETLLNWINDFLSSKDYKGKICIIDLSLLHWILSIF